MIALKIARSDRLRAVSGVIGALILFVMLFTVGTSYFVFVNTNNSRFSQAFFNGSSAVLSRLSENLVLTTLLYRNHIGVYWNNTGGIGVNATGLYVLDKIGTVMVCMGVGLPNSCAKVVFPYVDPGKGSGIVDTGYTPASGTTYIIKLVSQRGSVFTATYPPSSVSLAAQALSSGAIGDLYLAFHSLKWYTIVTCNTNQNCLQNPQPGFSVPASATYNPIAFSITVTNLNSQQQNITLDKYTFMTQFVPCTTGCGNQPTYTWFLVSNSSNVLSPFTGITLFYNRPVTLVFASQSAGTLTLCSGNSCPRFPSGTITFGFIISHGCLGISQSRCLSSPTYDNYGQVAPYVSTLYY